MINVKVGLHRPRGGGPRADRQGTTPYLVVGWLMLVAGIGAVAAEFGRMSIDQRKAQAATNQAAIAAASNLLLAEGVAAAAVSGTRISGTSEMTVVRGRYKHDPLVPKEQRFQPDPVNANAARVTVRAEAPLHVGRLFAGASSYTIAAEATAANTAFGAIAIGGRTLALQDNLINPLLSELLGARIELGPADFRSLAGVRIDLFRFLQALGSELGLSGTGYDRLVRQSVSASVALAALAKAARTEEGTETAASQALEAVAATSSRGAGSLVISSLFSPGPYSSLKVGEGPGGPAIMVSALDLLHTIAQTASSTRQAEVEIPVNAPGILGATIKLAVGERPASMSWIKAGAEGVNVQTVQTRVLMNLKLRGSGAISALDLPIVIEVANATAQLSSVRCDHLQPSRSTMTIDARPGAVDAWIGEPADFNFATMTAAMRPGPARIVDLPILRVSGSASVSVNNLYPNTLTFTQSEAQMRLVKSVGNRDFLGSLVPRLLQNLQFAIEKRDATESLPPAPTKLIGEILTTAAPSIERTVASTLDAVGLGVGRVDVMPLSLRCDGAVLVQ